MVRELIGDRSEPVHSTYFIRRLEAFNDVVFGFTLSILAGHIQNVDFDDPGRAAFALGLYFGTFALTASMWFTQYRTFHFAFAGERVDVLLNFVLLAFAVLVPLTLQRTMEPVHSSDQFISRFTPYAVAFGTVFFISGLLKLRGLKRFGDRLEPKIQKLIFRSAVVGMSTPFVFAASLWLTHYAGPAGTFGFGTIALISLALRRLPRVPPIFLPAAAGTGR